MAARPLTVLAAITTLFVGLTQGRPETNFAGSSISSDGSGTRSTQFVGTVPNSGGVGIGARVGSGQGQSGSGGGIAVVSGSGPAGGAVYSGSSNSGGGGSVGIFSRTGPSGTQHTVVGPSGTRVYNQPAAGSRFGSSRPGYAYPGASGYYNDYRNDNYDYYNDGGYNNGYYQPAVAVAGPGGAFAGAGAGGAGAFAGASAGGSPDYFG